MNCIVRLSILSIALVGLAVLAAETTRKWEGPWIGLGLGGQLKTTIYFGPWKCSAELFSACERECAAKQHKLMGCIWIADMKFDYQGVGVVKQFGSRAAVNHCCCDYPTVSNTQEVRKAWNKARPGYRDEWARRFGEWPKNGKDYWPGHHIFDLQHGGDPQGDVFPLPEDVHKVVNNAYPQCYSGKFGWNEVGPTLPYPE
ncbi:MAG TPA: hypothetical protein VK447_09710 [Myxococcaceae bacterium]|nr:hypothetical protein [Myxococcaceae bacterium]